MAKREGITILGDESPGFNVDQPVGREAVNNFDDVKLVQAMFNFIIQGPGGNTIGGRLTGMKSRYEIPLVSGKMEAKTLAAIATFQRRWAHNLIRAADGVIHPARYFRRNIATTGTGLMTITLLHQFCQNVAAENFRADDYTKLMRQQFNIQFMDLLPRQS